jgi:hypothetical protein
LRVVVKPQLSASFLPTGLQLCTVGAREGILYRHEVYTEAVGQWWSGAVAFA